MPQSCELTYCLNIHPAESLDDILSTLQGPVARTKALVSPDESFPVGLRVSATALAALEQPDARARLKSLMQAQDLRAISMNGFPYGPFHGTPVKEAVYLPDWRDDTRLAYTNGLVDLMTAISDENWISLSTVPGCFKANARGAEPLMAHGMIAAAAHAARAARETGKTVALAIEPEPCCFLETIEETLAFFETHIYGKEGVALMARLTGESRTNAETLIRAHLGLCYDVCHAAVEFEDAADSIRSLRAAGLPVHKLQLSAALRLACVDATGREALAGFQEPTYLHQVVSRHAQGLTRHTDLPEALARGAGADGEEWRVHFHVPVFLEDLGVLGTTQGFLADILSLHAQAPISRHLEIETYTWGVLPEHLRTGTIEEAIAREIAWVRKRIE